MRFGTAAGQRTNFADNLPGTATAAFALRILANGDVLGACTHKSRLFGNR
jgi:hypothetical protein